METHYVITSDHRQDLLDKDIYDSGYVLFCGSGLPKNRVMSWAKSFAANGYKNVALITTFTRPSFRFCHEGPSYGVYYSVGGCDKVEVVS